MFCLFGFLGGRDGGITNMHVVTKCWTLNIEFLHRNLSNSVNNDNNNNNNNYHFCSTNSLEAVSTLQT